MSALRPSVLDIAAFPAAVRFQVGTTRESGIGAFLDHDFLEPIRKRGGAP
jgi:hypothetical protein